MITFEEDGFADILIGAGNPAKPSLHLAPLVHSGPARPAPLPEIQLCVMDP